MEADGYTYDRDLPAQILPGFEILSRGRWLTVKGYIVDQTVRIGRGHRIFIETEEGPTLTTTNITLRKFRYRPAVAE